MPCGNPHIQTFVYCSPVTEAGGPRAIGDAVELPLIVRIDDRESRLTRNVTVMDCVGGDKIALYMYKQSCSRVVACAPGCE